MKILKSPGLIVSASGVSKTIFLSFGPDELGNRLTLLLQEKHAGNKFDKINEENVVTLDKLIEYECITKIQQKQLSIKCNLLHAQV